MYTWVFLYSMELSIIEIQGARQALYAKRGAQTGGGRNVGGGAEHRTTERLFSVVL